MSKITALGKCVSAVTLICTLAIALWFGMTSNAMASLEDDRYDGNIFALYAGNGALVPPKVSLAESMRGGKPSLLVFYLEDSKDCKAFSVTVSELQRYYGRVASFIPINVDMLADENDFTPTEAGYYYRGLVPQTVIIDQEGDVAFNEVGQVSFERIDDAFREVFDLLPRSRSKTLKRRPLNNINVGLEEE
ncbi:MAG: thylakoid membrane photosystem I accumulation factor [Halothece sp. Uz-M2-17]|nr:thylakoid membrane photosystem I accumulation factor [Halothece sp. Uz-M2-17]